MKNQRGLGAGMQFRWLAAVVAGLMAMAPGGALAQDSGASLRGNVIVGSTDSASGMRVVADSVDSGFRRAVNVRSDGSYALPSLRVGSYNIELRSEDGSLLTSQDITLQVGQNATMTLIPDSLAGNSQAIEEVVVVGQAIQNEIGSEVGLNISQEQINSLPQNSRNFLAFADLAPGVTFERDGNGATRIQGGAQSSQAVNIFIDGVGQKDYVLKNGITGQDSSQGNPFPQSAIGEYRVITQNYKAEFDQVSSAAVVAVTQSGTNEFHGSAFFDFTDDSLRSRTPREIELGEPKVETTDEQFGASFGGPILRDTLHFFLAYEGKRNQVPVEISPGAGVDPADLPAEYQSIFGVYNKDFEEDLFFGKLDFYPSDLDLVQFSVKVREESGLRWDSGPNARSFSHDINNDETRVLLRYERTADTWINDLRLTYEETAWNPQPDREVTSFLNLSGEQRIVNVGGHPNFQDKGQEGYGIQNDFTWIRFDDHEIKAGIKMKWIDLSTVQQQPFNPQYLYNTEFDPGGTGAFNDTIPYRVSIGTGLGDIGDGSATSDNFQFGIYIQDDWLITDRFELSYGIRWDYDETPVYLDYVTPADVLASLDSWVALDNANYNIDNFISTGNNRDTFDGAFAPRIGFSYDLTEDGQYTLFGGYGRSYNLNQFDFIAAEERGQTFRTFTFNFDTGDPAFPCVGCPVWDPVYLTEDGRQQLLTGNVDGGGRQIFLLNNELEMPYSDQYSLGVRSAWDYWDAEVGVSRIEAREGFAWLLGNRMDDGAFFAPGAIWGQPFGFPPPGFGNLLIGVNGLETDQNTAYLKAGKRYDEDSGWGINFTYTYTDAEENRKFGETFSLDYPSLDDYPMLTSAGVSKHRVVAAGSYDLPWDVKLSGKYSYRSPIYVYGIGRPGDADNQRVPRVTEAEDDFQQLDLALSKTFNVGSFGVSDGGQLRLRLDVINVLDHANIDAFVGNGTSEDFGRIANRGIGGNQPRTTKLSVTYTF